MSSSEVLQLVAAILLAAVVNSSGMNCPPGCSFGNMESHTTIVCSDANWTRFPENLETSLKVIDFSNNKIEQLIADTFKGLKELISIELQYNSIKTIHEDTFKTLSKLLYLDLSFNEIGILPLNIFKTNSNLEVLYLKRNSLTITNDGASLLLPPSLKELDLSFCQIVSLPKGTFYGLESLQSLNLAGNHISSIDKDSIKTLTNLNTLILSVEYLDCNDAATLETIYYLNNTNITTSREEIISMCQINDDETEIDPVLVETKMYSALIATPETVAAATHVESQNSPFTAKYNFWLLIIGSVTCLLTFIVVVIAYCSISFCLKKWTKKPKSRMPMPEIHRKDHLPNTYESVHYCDYPILGKIQGHLTATDQKRVAYMNAVPEYTIFPSQDNGYDLEGYVNPKNPSNTRDSVPGWKISYPASTTVPLASASNFPPYVSYPRNDKTREMQRHGNGSRNPFPKQKPSQSRVDMSSSLEPLLDNREEYRWRQVYCKTTVPVGSSLLNNLNSYISQNISRFSSNNCF